MGPLLVTCLGFDRGKLSAGAAVPRNGTFEGDPHRLAVSIGTVRTGGGDLSRSLAVARGALDGDPPWGGQSESMSDLISCRWLPIVALLLPILFCAWRLADSLFPAWVRRSQAYCRHQPIVTTMLGILLAAPFVLVGLGLLDAGGWPALTAGTVVLATLFFLALPGAAGLARVVGERWGSGTRFVVSPVSRGGIILCALGALPWVGWLGVLPFTLLAGVGASVRSWWGMRRERLAGDTDGRS